jgi:hypothetical protein
MIQLNNGCQTIWHPLHYWKKNKSHVTPDHTLFTHPMACIRLILETAHRTRFWIVSRHFGIVPCAMYVSMLVLTRSTFSKNKIENRLRIDSYPHGILVNFTAENQCLTNRLILATTLVQSVTVPSWPHDTVALQLVLAAAVHVGTAAVSIWKSTSHALDFNPAYKH